MRCRDAGQAAPVTAYDCSAEQLGIRIAISLLRSSPHVTSKNNQTGRFDRDLRRTVVLLPETVLQGLGTVRASTHLTIGNARNQ